MNSNNGRNAGNRRKKGLAVVVVAFAVLICVEVCVFAKNHGRKVKTDREVQANRGMLDETVFVRMDGLNPRVGLMYRPRRYNSLMAANPKSTQITGREQQIKEEMQAFIDKITNETAPRFGYVEGTTGIATSCRINKMCLLHLHMLAHVLKGSVPVELWLERGADAPRSVAYVEQTFGPQVRVRYFDETDAAYTAYFGPLRRLYRCFFHRKLQALVSSSFQRVFWLDSDVMLLRDPRTVLGAPEVERTGTMLWRDMSGIMRENRIWDIMDRAPLVGQGGESGVVYIDKARAWRGLYLAAFMNQAQSTYYRMVFGDKDTFFLAFDRLKAPHYMLPYMPLPLGPDEGGHSFIHATPDARMFFLHLVGGGKASLLEYLDAGRDAFTTVQLFDPNHAHIGSCTRGVLCIKRDTTPTTVRWLSAREVLGDYLTAITNAYHKALKEEKDLSLL